MINPPLASDLQNRAKNVFGEVCIDKGLFLDSGMISRSIPTFVAEWILDRFCPNGELTDDIQDKINLFIRKHLPRKDQKEEIKHQLSQGEVLTILDHFSVYVDLKSNTHRVHIPCIDERGYIEGHILDRFPNLLGGGIWGAGKIIYHPPDPESPSSNGQVWLREFTPMQVAHLDVDYYCEARSEFSLIEWRELLVNAMGSNPHAYTPLQQQHLLTRLIPLVQKRVNLIELAPKGTGKSFIYQNLSRHVRVVSGGKVTAPVLFYNLQSRTPGLLTSYDVVVFDEAQTISFDNPGEVVGILKDYLESGRYTRGNQQATADASFVLLGNIPLDSRGKPREALLFYNLPNFLQETAFIDRLHGILPGWELPRFTANMPARGVGFKADFFSAILHALRERPGYDEYVSAHMQLHGTDDMRDKKAIQRLTSGFLRLLFPNMKVTPEEFQTYCIEPSVRLRQTIRGQLSLLDPEYKVVKIRGEFV
ncbi:MAG: TIGR02688 family protein [Anaerolineaceae bacterium]|nr:TIGR02688 family protein [Anaerolineaceae bacterium]